MLSTRSRGKTAAILHRAPALGFTSELGFQSRYLPTYLGRDGHGKNLAYQQAGGEKLLTGGSVKWPALPEGQAQCSSAGDLGDADMQHSREALPCS